MITYTKRNCIVYFNTSYVYCFSVFCFFQVLQYTCLMSIRYYVIDLFEENPSVTGVENQLIQNLLANYSRWGRPIADVSKPVQVSITFYLTQLMSLVCILVILFGYEFGMRTLVILFWQTKDINIGIAMIFFFEMSSYFIK